MLAQFTTGLRACLSSQTEEHAAETFPRTLLTRLPGNLRYLSLALVLRRTGVLALPESSID